MPIEVELPDGSVAEFPDGTDRATIQRAIQQRIGRPNAAPVFRGPDVQPLQNGMPMDQATHQRQDFRELPPSFRNMSPEQALEAARGGGELRLRNADPNAQLSQDRYGNPTMTMNGQQYYFNKPGITTSDIRQGAERALEGAADVAPYLSTGVGTAAMRALPAMAAQAVTGIMAEGTNQAMEAMNGGEFDWREVGKMSLTAAAGEGIGRAIVGVLGGILGRFAGKSIKVTNSDGTLTDDAIRILRENNVNPAQLDDAVRQQLTQSNALTPEQAERFNLFQRYGMTGTRAQVMRTADDFQQQQELLKRSGSVRNALEGQRVQVNNLMEGVANSSNPGGTTAYDAITSKAIQLDDEIGRLYQTARGTAPTEKFVRLDSTMRSLSDVAGENDISGGLVGAIKNHLKSRGVIDDQWKVVGRIDVDTAEGTRQYINSLYNSTTDRGRQIIRQLKDSLDDDVFRAAGDDVFRAARQAKANFEAGLRNTRANKFDQHTRSLVRDVLENRVNPDKFLEQTVLSSSRRADDLKELKNYLLSGSDEQVAVGGDAWNTLRRDTLEYIRGQAFQSQAVGEQGVAELSAPKFRQALQRIGMEKMKVLFNRDELSFIDDMLKIAEARTPVDMTYTGKGPSAQAIQSLSEKLSDIATNGNSGFIANTLGGFLDLFRARPVTNPNIPGMVQQSLRRGGGQMSRAARSVGGASGAYAADR